VALTLEPIGYLRSPYTDRFGIPRQSGLVTAGEARLELLPPYAREEAFHGIEGFSHLWLIFVFHTCLGAGWRPSVRPPRLGGQRKVGVFASRAPYRPNPIGLSAVELLGLVRDGRGLALRLRGADLLDGTPVLDIKPYVPYADALPQARGGFAKESPASAWRIELAEEARVQIASLDPGGTRQVGPLIEQMLHQDPRPGYMDRYPGRDAFVMRLYDLEVHWTLRHGVARVTAVEPVGAQRG
jgi:tRNA-Thr(GGU) m(6)t(6)A37 methyltransferase TsaA